MKQYLTASLSNGILDVDILKDEIELESAIKTHCNSFLNVTDSEELKDFLEKENLLDDVELAVDNDHAAF